MFPHALLHKGPIIEFPVFFFGNLICIAILYSATLLDEWRVIPKGITFTFDFTDTDRREIHRGI